jgi:thioredoxin 1
MPEASSISSRDPAPVIIACLCAQWCGVCRDYRERFAQAATRFPEAQFIWIDIEDEAGLVDALDVTDFPSLLVAIDGQPRFFGPLTPQPETLDRLLRSCLATPPPPLDDAALHALAAQLAARKP